MTACIVFFAVGWPLALLLGWCLMRAAALGDAKTDAARAAWTGQDERERNEE